MIPVISVVTSVKDYLEVVHKLIEFDSESLSSYSEIGPMLTYFIISIKEFLGDFFSLAWLKNIWSLPIIIPDISSAMISEISVLDGYFHNAFQLLDMPAMNPNEKTLGLISGLQKFTIGLLNSFFLFLPTSTAHIITLRRFVMQGLEAGYISGLGTIAGNVFWLASVILGWRFFVIPWLSLDILRYVLGFAILVKYMWDSYNERKMVLEDLSKRKIFLLNFLLALTEQTSIYPFISNISLSPEASILESSSADNYMQFLFINGSYLAGIAFGSFCLLQFTCWFWENPVFKIYMWVISTPGFKVSTSFYFKALNFVFLYLTMLSAIASIPYYGLDYTITNPLGFVNDDRLVQDKTVLETSFLGTKSSDRNTRRNRGRHGRRERWKRRIRKYRTFDASLYDQGIYDLFTIEDLNYGFDRFWLRRKLRNHRVRFRFFPGPWMRSFKKQLAKPRLESYTGPRIEFFRTLFEQVYHPSFHARTRGTNISSNTKNSELSNSRFSDNRNASTFPIKKQNLDSLILKPDAIQLNKLKNAATFNGNYGIKKNLVNENSVLRKFVRKLDSRLKTAEIVRGIHSDNNSFNSNNFSAKAELSNSVDVKLWALTQNNNKIYSKRWKQIFSKIYHEPKDQISTSSLLFKNVHRNLYNSSLVLPKQMNIKLLDSLDEKQKKETLQFNNTSMKKQSSSLNNLSNKDLQILRYRSALSQPLTQSGLQIDPKRTDQVTASSNQLITGVTPPLSVKEQPFVLLHPLKFYLQQEAALQRKLSYYTPNIFRKFSVENNAPYFRVMMRRYFYNYKPNNRWERTMKVASLRKARRKTTRTPRKLRLPQILNTNSISNSSRDVAEKPNSLEMGVNNNFADSLSLRERIQKPTYNYSVVSKKASRYRYQIYKDVMQHWYYSPFNRLLLKFDVDNFIRRQPKNHFLTSNEENLLHLRRFFLSEHYNTLRWYTNMEHYRTMKTKIGGSKSFSSGAYNQQFSGTFKKIRHLFSITPSINSSFPFVGVENAEKDRIPGPGPGPGKNPQSSFTQDENAPTVLKFDQLLYNEYPNNSKNPLLKPLVIHEELFNSPLRNNNSSNIQTLESMPFANQDLLAQSQNIVREYLKTASPKRSEYITQLLNSNNYSSLTKFLYNGQKLRGNSPTTNQKLLAYQEKDYLLTDSEKIDIEKEVGSLHHNSSEIQKLLRQSFNPFLPKSSEEKSLQPSLDNLYTSFLKNWKRRANNQEALKNYLTRRIEKREKRKAFKEKSLQQKLDLLNKWIHDISTTQSVRGNNDKSIDNVNLMSVASNEPSKILSSSNIEYLTSGLQKAIVDGKTVANSDSVPGIKFNRDSSSNVVASQTTLRNFQKDKLRKEIQITTNQLNSITQELSNKPVSTKTRVYLKTKLRSIFKTFKNTYAGLSIFHFNQITKFLRPMKQKTIKDWRMKQRFIGKQKRLRKEFKLLLTKKQSSQQSVFNLPSRKKRVESQNVSINLDNALANDRSESPSFFKNSFVTSLFNFKRERSPQRRYRVRRNRGVFRKRNLGELINKDIKNFYNKTLTVESPNSPDNTIKRNRFYNKIHSIYSGASTTQSDSSQRIDNLLEADVNSTTLPFTQTRVKQRKNKERKLRTWKQKRTAIRGSQKRRKYLKRRRYAISKIRVLSKQFQRVKNKLEVQNWWWKQYLPSIQASTDAIWQIEKDRLIQQKLSELSPKEILERDSRNLNNELQIGNKDFKPLALPQAMNINSSLNNSSKSLIASSGTSSPLAMPNTNLSQQLDLSQIDCSKANESSNQLINQLYKNLLINNPNSLPHTNQSNFNSKSACEAVKSSNILQKTSGNVDSLFNSSVGLVPNTSLPFYAGWDESLRKFVVTNRLLSRQDAGYEIDNSFISSSNSQYSSMDNNRNPKQKFTEAPLNGMNAATTLYWQIPFTTYDPDQFFALGMDGFSPIAWRKMLFRHSILKTWLGDKMMLNKTTDSAYPQKGQSIVGVQKSSNHSDLLRTFKDLSLKNPQTQRNLSSARQDGFNTARRLNKRLSRVKKHPRTPVWFPSGPLLNQVLPVHYIYVFYKRSRLPNNRYLSRRFLNSNTINNSETLTLLKASNPALANYDFTLRKRLKPKRKYHLKHDTSIVIPRRLKFLNFTSGRDTKTQIAKNTNLEQSNINSLIRWRPLSSKKLNKPLSEFMMEQKSLRSKRQQRLSSTSPTDQPSLRVKQLKRRVQRQVLRSVWRYRPRSGGFVWPGDYLKLELVKAPKLKRSDVNNDQFEIVNSSEINSNPTLDVTSIQEAEAAKGSLESSLKRKTKRKKKRSLVEWQVQPKKYLYEKHNIKVLKKKLEKSQRSSSFPLQKTLQQLSL